MKATPIMVKPAVSTHPGVNCFYNFVSTSEQMIEATGYAAKIKPMTSTSTPFAENSRGKKGAINIYDALEIKTARRMITIFLSHFGVYLSSVTSEQSMLSVVTISFCETTSLSSII
jgi:hypothetical protein